jgi:hypothetical protein
MQHEYSSLMDSGTWELVDLPLNRVVVNNMWMYKVKFGTTLWLLVADSYCKLF